ncbi:efflux RND transporter periplasmic adaptor subunit [Pedobacter metabolipauper]|uniref:Membrane fusion protein (Multidrug efflux system) n=1 Tax=Pedobacter metabolipauper TaxID=425513 RepID=A0A4R6SUP8_9SPHI|nr:efflux RND transporter periplasmic adaptor subunit [Pedobacter metabolipauper]TDQ08141.1 membrane fusion protein (multidrug efflux system) [Pedobacter metabolipauper]
MNYISSYTQSLNAVKWSNRVAISAALVFALFLYGCSNDKLQVSAPVVQTLPVISVNNSSEITFLEYPASIEGAVDLEIRPQVSGSLDQIYVNEGALVTKGQSLFKINELPFKEDLNNAKALLQSANAAALNAQLEVDKLTPLVANKVVSDFQLKSAKAAHQMAMASVEQAKAGVAAAKINLGYTLITAPVTGYVGRLPKKQGSLVSSSDPIPLTQLSDAHEVHVYFSLGEDDFISFNEKYPGKTVAERIKNIPGVSLLLADNTIYPNQGKVDMIDGQFDKQTGSITLRATFANKGAVLRSGNTGKIRLSLTHQNALAVPQESTIEIQDKVFVFSVDKNNKVTKQPITVLGASGTNYLIKDGLKSGDRIVFKGMESLKDGDAIKPEEKKNLTAINISK